MSLVFHAATAADIPVLGALIQRAYRGDAARRGWTHEADLLEGQRIDAHGLTAILTDPAQHLLVAERDNIIVGCVQLADKGSAVAYLGLLTVDPQCQAEGLGRSVLAYAERFAAEVLGVAIVEMTVIRQRTELIDWYHRRDYVATGEVRPFPYGDTRFGLPQSDDLEFVVLAKRMPSLLQL